MLTLVYLAVLVGALYWYFRRTYSKFSKAGVRHQPVYIPGLGNMADVLFRKSHVILNQIDTYNLGPRDRFVGKYEFLRPVIFIKDLELVKKVTIKDFDHFVDRRVIFDVDIEPIFGRNLAALRGDEWRDMRSTLSPAFTSSKIRLMVPFMVEVGKQMADTLKKKINDAGGEMEIDVKDLSTRYANDVIGTCAFGLKVNSQAEDTYFYKTAKKVTTISTRSQLAFFAMMFLPFFGKIFPINLLDDETKQFFENVVLGTMKHREEQNIIRPDMIHLLMEARKGKLNHETQRDKDDAGFATVEESDVGKRQITRKWTDNDLMAQALVFLFAGFETVSTTVSFMLFELAANPDVQDRLAKEIRDHHASSGGNIDFNEIQNLTYLDMVISESLRRWSPAPGLERTCLRDYNLGKPNDEATADYIVRKGDTVVIPAFGHHLDPTYFPNPTKFDPERFSIENKHKINPLAYMPFGAGPRNCIGSRFALCELKVLTYQLLNDFELTPCARSCIPIELSLTDGFSMKIKGGHYLKIKVRS